MGEILKPSKRDGLISPSVSTSGGELVKKQKQDGEIVKKTKQDGGLVNK